MISLRSSITKKILNYFLINPHESLYVNELSRKLFLDKRNLVKKIKELEQDGIMTHETRGNLKLYSINTHYPMYKEYRKIIMANIGVEEQLKKILHGAKDVKEVYIYGSYARDSMASHSDVDMLVIGSISTIALQKLIHKLQNDIDREINATVMSESEFKKRLKNKDPFVGGILKQKHIKVI